MEMYPDSHKKGKAGDDSPQYNADWSWFLRWMLITSVAAGAAPMIQAWFWKQGVTSPLLMAGVGAAVLYGAQAFELPHPLRGVRRRWLAYGVVGGMVGTYFSGPAIRFVFDMLDPFGRISLTFVLIAIPNAVPIILHWTILRLHTSRARVWFYVMFAGMLGATWLVSVSPTWSLVRGEMLLVVRGIFLGLGLNVAAGGTLWWLFHHERSSD